MASNFGKPHLISVPLEKRSWNATTCSPAKRSAPGTVCRPKFSSVKKTTGSGGEGEFAADRFFDLGAFATIIFGQRVH